MAQAARNEVRVINNVACSSLVFAVEIYVYKAEILYGHIYTADLH